jgi:hypothetical protein
MALTWFVGVIGMRTGFQLAMYLRDATVPDVATVVSRVAGSGDLWAVYGVVKLEALVAIRKIAFPLTIAQTLLSGLLVVASGLAMGGRRGSRSLALQALVANAILTAVAYAATSRARGAGIDAVIRIAGSMGADPAPSREGLWWLARIWLVAVELGTLALGALALTRARVKTYFDAVARATESAEEP